MKPFLRRPNVAWHATDLQEQQDIRRHVGSRAQVTIAGNVPAVLNNNPTPLFRKDELRVVTVALVVRMKNHITFLNVLKDYKGEKRVIYDIYGPLRDHEYWQECLRLIERMPPNVTVNYKGAVEPQKVAGILSQYHCFVLPTFGENFGHSIFEALAAGLPVLISDKTPWNHVQDLQAGWVVPDNNRMDWHKAFKEAITLTPQQWQEMSENARFVARNYLKEAGLEGKYQRLLGR
ncbi:glycosyltransferase family 4 protein [Thermophagus xiamenensis]|nr:glycosyltransferase family 4 protein [Thermophagus xiamenensis]